jgi:glycosyltransferase involved in cell wall biosynthesis
MTDYSEAVTVIVTALNEPYLDRTLETLFAETPELSEVIVVDDASDPPIKSERSRVRVLRNQQRSGLIRGRQLALEAARPGIVISLDAHVMVHPGWLRPILDELRRQPAGIVIPTTCTLDPESWVARRGTVAKTSWRWNLDFYWCYDDGTSETPGFAGHCFAFRRDWLLSVGGFDEAMIQWGGENLDVALLAWLSGASVRLARESLVAHWFRSRFSNYSVSGSAVLRNKARVAEVWLDEWRDEFYRAVRKRPGSIATGDLTKRLRNRIRVQRRPFEWFLERFQPELTVIYGLRNAFPGSKVAIVGAGPSLDDFDLDRLRQYDLVIGLNYVGLLAQCDYVMFHDWEPLQVLLQANRYEPRRLLAPKPPRGAHGLLPDICYLSLAKQDEVKALDSCEPPFFHHASVAHTAAHFAAFLGAQSVVMIACSGEPAAEGRSHTCRIPQYRSGYYWPNNKDTEAYLRRLARGSAALDEAFSKWGKDLLWLR